MNAFDDGHAACARENLEESRIEEEGQEQYKRLIILGYEAVAAKRTMQWCEQERREYKARNGIRKLWDKLMKFLRS
jgi:cellobiose phosphorylase